MWMNDRFVLVASVKTFRRSLHTRVQCLLQVIRKGLEVWLKHLHFVLHLIPLC